MTTKKSSLFFKDEYYYNNGNLYLFIFYLQNKMIKDKKLNEVYLLTLISCSFIKIAALINRKNR
jgi:hypothetical protein